MKTLIKTWVRRFSQAIPGCAASPIFILGNQKSGTTAIAALLAERADCTAALDIPAIHRDGAPKYLNGEMTIESLRREVPGVFTKSIIKEPVLTFYSTDIANLYPHSKIVFIVRDARDNIRSILNRVNLPGNLRSQPALDSVSAAWREVLENQKLGMADLFYIESLARRWIAAIDHYIAIQDRAILVRYEDFLKDKSLCIDSLCSTLSLPTANDISQRLDHQFQSKGNSSVTWDEFYGAENLKIIESTCGPHLQKMRYMSQ